MSAAEPKIAPLTPEQKAAQAEADKAKKAADEKAAAIAKADQEFQADVAAAVAKRNKTLVKFVEPTIDGITCEAYEATKGPGDPAFKDAILEYRQKLSTHAESVIRTGLPEKPTAFEKKVADLMAKPEYKDLGAQSQVTWGESEAREAVAEDFKGGEDEKGVLAKGAKADSKDKK